MAPPIAQRKILTNEEVDALSAQLRDASTDIKVSALGTLGNSIVPSDAITLADALVEVLQSDAGSEIKGRAAVIMALWFASTAKYARALFAAVDAIEVFNPLLLSRLPRDQMYVPEWIAILKHSDAARGRYLRYVYSGPFDTSITQEIIAAMSDDDAGARTDAVTVLASIFTHSKEQSEIAKPALLVALKDLERSIAFIAAKALRSREATVPEANQLFDETIQTMLCSEDANSRKEALQNLGDVSKGDVKYLERLMELLSGTYDDQLYSVMVLERLGTHGRPAIARLKQLLFEKKHITLIAKLLAAIDTQNQEVVDWLAEQLMPTKSNIRGLEITFTIALTYFGKQGVPYLIKGLDWPNPLVQSNCVEQLGHVGKDAEAAIPHLLQRLDHGDGRPLIPACGVEGRSALIGSLVKIAPEDERFISRLRAIAQVPDDPRCGVAAQALEAMEAGKPSETEKL